MATQKALAFGKWLCNKYKVKYNFGHQSQCYARPWENYIYICKDLPTNDFLSGVFHEIQHCINYRNGKYKVYHKKGTTLKEYKRWSLPAEIYTDNMAKKLAADHKFYDYVITYKNDQKSKKFLKDYIEEIFDV